eukprot:gnl/TRDRNA2_/TRDRNA2_78290_c0_seq1.p1 gnl/TRDRNA2_/TRDRNA2_78290_c0~~gnl/TRDRNA2_/TRDRNA2_78290_c0_seq1.p1  ORF type:complete len:225 (+),score=43.47 gnl/TRDRNA2_/TRDRNA2_78290_c0_seq1:76-750(+)
MGNIEACCVERDRQPDERARARRRDPVLQNAPDLELEGTTKPTHARRKPRGQKMDADDELEHANHDRSLLNAPDLELQGTRSPRKPTYIRHQPNGPEVPEEQTRGHTIEPLSDPEDSLPNFGKAKSRQPHPDPVEELRLKRRESRHKEEADEIEGSKDSKDSSQSSGKLAKKRSSSREDLNKYVAERSESRRSRELREEAPTSPAKDDDDLYDAVLFRRRQQKA